MNSRYSLKSFPSFVNIGNPCSDVVIKKDILFRMYASLMASWVELVSCVPNPMPVLVKPSGNFRPPLIIVPAKLVEAIRRIAIKIKSMFFIAPILRPYKGIVN